ncbi:CST complex subunit Ten1 [Phyllosticta citricarpa]|uniref:CST complex subunit Ten1 n=1 Tax=Phyllosticta citricarpa TaxID=55181 RepID=A0ABR1M7D5_9PEZI
MSSRKAGGNLWGPPASQLILLSDLRSMDKGTKVRFLGCVERYDVKKGILTLNHSYPTILPPISAYVQVDHVLESAHATDLQTGAWINIVGYVGAKGRDAVQVQAIMMWAAGELKLDEYEESVNARKVCDIVGLHQTQQF